MSVSEISEWLIYEQMEPFGDRRADLLAGLICSVLANVNRGRDTKPYEPDDFMYKWESRPPVQQSPEEQMKTFMAVAALQNAAVEAQANG